jgi:hypothetical protein
MNYKVKIVLLIFLGRDATLQRIEADAIEI